MTTGMVRDQNLEKHIHKQIGCMAGFLQIFDRNQILTGKRIYSTKRLPPVSPESEKPSASASASASASSPSSSSSSTTSSRSPPSLAKEAVVESEPKASAIAPTLPVLEFKEGTRSSWKFAREAPRLSLDSRAMVDAKGSLHRREIKIPHENDTDKQRRSTSSSSSSVIAKLMGLEPLLDSEPKPIAKLQRSASESRVSRDLPLPLPHCRSFDANNFTNGTNVVVVQHNNNNNHINNNNDNVNNYNYNYNETSIDNRLPNGRATDPPRQRTNVAALKKSFYDSADFFPEPKHTVSVYGEIERRLRMRGINQPSKDLHTLKHILEALQLKGLLHSNAKSDQSPIVLMKPVRSVDRTGNDSPPLRSSPRRSPRPEYVRTQARGGVLSSSPNRRKVQIVEPQRKVGVVDSRRVSATMSPVHSPKMSPRKNASPHVPSGSPRMRKNNNNERKEKVVVLGGAEDESCNVSEHSFSTCSYPDTERYRMEEYKEGKDLLDRCDKLLNSIAEITAANELQPSPVSVLDSSFYKDDWSSPSPITKRCIDYKDQAAESEDDMWSAALCSSEEAEDCDFVYVSEILRACSYLPEESDVFLLLEKQQCLKGKDTSKASTMQRKLIFDTLQEILYRNQQLPPWKAVSCGEERQRIWSEFRRIREREESESEDVFKVICGVLRKDMTEDMCGWDQWPVEMGDVVLDIERLVFKDLVGEIIRELASFSVQQCNNNKKLLAFRRKLVF